MEVSLIYDLLAPSKIDKYREKLENDDSDVFKQDEIKAREKLEQSLNEEQAKLLKDYLHYLDMLEGYVDFQVEVRTLNYGIKIGAQLQHSIKDLYRYFDEENDYE